MMKRRCKVFGLLLFVAVLLSIAPVTVFADCVDGVDCEYCDSYRYDDWLCEGGPHCSENASGDCYMYHHCRECGACEDGDFCEDHLMCISCAQGAYEHCMDCGACSLDTDFCEEHGFCKDCEYTMLSPVVFPLFTQYTDVMLATCIFCILTTAICTITAVIAYF